LEMECSEGDHKNFDALSAHSGLDVDP